LELVDAVAVNKADGPLLERAQLAKAEYSSALHLFAPSPGGWVPPVLLCSAETGVGIPEIWEGILRHEDFQLAGGLRAQVRREQSLSAMRQLISADLESTFRHDPEISVKLPLIEEEVRNAKITPFAAARILLDDFHRSKSAPGD
jgi:LAO/AO transport system kinase